MACGFACCAWFWDRDEDTTTATGSASMVLYGERLYTPGQNGRSRKIWSTPARLARLSRIMAGACSLFGGKNTDNGGRGTWHIHTYYLYSALLLSIFHVVSFRHSRRYTIILLFNAIGPPPLYHCKSTANNLPFFAAYYYQRVVLITLVPSQTPVPTWIASP